MTFQPITLGDAGVLAPGRWRWARALGWMLALMAMTIALSAVGPVLQHAAHIPANAARAIGLVASVLTYVAYVVLVRWAERRSPAELAPRALVRELLIGLAIGTGMFALVFASLRLTGLYTIAPGNWTDWPHDVLQMTGVGFGEELIARGIIFRLLMRAFGLWPALIGSSLLFGAAHLGNPNATWLGAAAIAVEAGLMLAGFYLLTGRLGMSIGVHIAWNFMQGPVLGARVSGHPEVGSLFVSAPVNGAPEWLSGGIFGPEASLSAMLVGTLVFVAVYLAARRRRFV